MKYSQNSSFYSLILLLSGLFSSPLFANEIEARRWTHLPVGTNIIGLAGARTDGDIFIDPVLLLEDVELEMDTVVTSFLHSFNLFDKTARFDVRLPYQKAHWQGLLDGEPRSAKREGLGDPLFRLSVNFLGAPALKGDKYRSYRTSHTTNTVVGAAVAVRVPLGQYKEDKLLNLGQNRYTIRPQLGMVHTRGPIAFELTGSVNFFTDNDEFWNGNKLEQDPLYFLQTHLTYSFKNKFWTSIAAGYDWGGQSKINGIKKDDQRQDIYFAISTGFPVSQNSSIKFSYVGGRTQENIGADTNNFIMGYSVRF